MGTITRTLQFKIGGFDTPNSTELQIFHAMVTNNKIDFARLILNELIEKVVKKAKSNVVPCARILSVIIERCLTGYYTGTTGPTVIIQPICYTIFSPTKVNQPLLPAMLDALAEEEEDDDDDTLAAAKKKAKAKGKASSSQPDVAPEAEATHAKKGKGKKANVSEAESEAEAEIEVEAETESDPEITKISSKGLKSVSPSLISSSTSKTSKAEDLTKKRKPKSNPTPASQSDPKPPPSKKLKPSPTISPTGTEVLDMLSSFAEGGETAGHLSPPLSPPRIPVPPRKPRTLKLKGKPQAESVQHSKGLPSSTLPSKKGSGVLKRTTPHGSTPSFSEQPSSLHKRSVDKPKDRSPKRVKQTHVSESTKFPTQTSVHSESALAVNVSPRSQGVSQATNSALHQEVPSTTSLDEPIMTGLASAILTTSKDQEVVKVPTHVALESLATTHAQDSATAIPANDTLPMGKQGNEASQGVQDISMTSSIEKETSQRVHDSTSISQLEDETPHHSSPIGYEPPMTSHIEGEPSHPAHDISDQNQSEGEATTIGEDALITNPFEAEPMPTTTEFTQVGQEFILEGESSYLTALKGFLNRLHPAATTISGLPNPYENMATTSTSGTIRGDLSVPSSSMGVHGEAPNEVVQSEQTTIIEQHQLEPPVNLSQADREITASAIPHLEPLAPDASSLSDSLNRNQHAQNNDPRGINVFGAFTHGLSRPIQALNIPPQPATSINDVVVQLTEIKRSINLELSNLHKRLDKQQSELTETSTKLCDNVEEKVTSKLTTFIEACLKDSQTTEDAFNKHAKDHREFLTLLVEEQKNSISNIEATNNKIGATLSQMGTVFNQATSDLHTKLKQMSLSFAVSNFTTDARFTKLERNVETILQLLQKKNDDDKKGEKIVDLDDDNNDDPKDDKKNDEGEDDSDNDDDGNNGDNPMSLGPVKRPQPKSAPSSSRKKSIGRKHKGKMVETEEALETESAYESEAKANSTSLQVTETETPMVELSTLENPKATQSETQTEAEAQTTTIHTLSSSTDEDADPATISKILSKHNDGDNDSVERLFSEEDLESETDSDAFKGQHPSLEKIIKDARAAGVTSADIEELEVVFAQALSSGVPFSDLLNQRSREAEHRLAMERDEASLNLAKAIAAEELDEATGEGVQKIGLDPFDAQKVAMRNAKVAAEAEKLKAHQAERQRATEATRDIEAGVRAESLRAKSLERNVNFRSKKEPITKVQIKKYKDHVTPSIIIFRSGKQVEDMVVDLEEIKKLGYSEWIEIHKLAQSSTSQHRDRVLALLTKLCGDIAKLNVDTSNIVRADPLTDEQRDVISKQRKKTRLPKFIPSPSSHTLIDQLLSSGGDMSKLNFTLPPMLSKWMDSSFKILNRVL